MDDREVAPVLPEPGTLALLEDDAQAARGYASEALSPATRRAYQSDVDAFMAWCRRRGADPLPAEPEFTHRFF